MTKKFLARRTQDRAWSEFAAASAEDAAARLAQSYVSSEGGASVTEILVMPVTEIETFRLNWVLETTENAELS
jgi:hypothetical protein